MAALRRQFLLQAAGASRPAAQAWPPSGLSSSEAVAPEQFVEVATRSIRVRSNDPTAQPARGARLPKRQSVRRLWPAPQGLIELLVATVGIELERQEAGARQGEVL